MDDMPMSGPRTDWIDELSLPRHAALLRGLIRYADTDDAVRFVELGCSVARGAGDELSDLDLGIGIADEAWPAALDNLEAALRGLAPVADLLQHEIASWAGRPHRRFFVQYEDLTQIDLVAMPAAIRAGLPPGSVALYDADGRLASPIDPRQQWATAEDVREWTFEAFVALLNMDKYLRRSSAWEALEQLHQARTLVWRLWAVARQVPFATFGLTAVLDADAVGPPPGLEATVARLDVADLRRAGQALLRLLLQVGDAACERVGAVYPDGMGRVVAERWAATAAPPEGEPRSS
jgi:hypothetical protein